jgi:hypothetical protein
MISNTLFVLMTGIVASLYLRWGFTRLTHEKMQILASMPDKKQPGGSWVGINLTWYGLLSANAMLFAAAIYLVLAGSMEVPFVFSLLLLAVLLGILLPAARLIARIVEKKNHTFTVGGSVFAGVVLAPFVIGLLNLVLPLVSGFRYPMVSMLSAMAVAYAFGESLGRLACISFGCCYGKPLADVPPMVRRLFYRHGFVFTGNTRKACYASDLEGVATFPVQAVTAVIYAMSATTGLALFLWGHTAWALLEILVITQLWRVVSEFFRGDFRGAGTFSAYQVMGMIIAVIAAPMAFLLPGSSGGGAEIVRGLSLLRNPALIVVLQLLWLVTFMYMGRSTVTFSRIEFYVDVKRV